jgi:hypothetical protein
MPCQVTKSDLESDPRNDSFGSSARGEESGRLSALMSYKRRIDIEGKAWKEAIEARDKLWREDLLSGRETEEEAAYRLRCHSVERLDFKAVICDSCGERPAYGGVLMFGSPEWILAGADARGWAVPKRWELEAPPALDGPDVTRSSARTFAVCDSCHPALADYNAGVIDVVVEPGNEESWEALTRWQSGGQNSEL